MHCSATILTHNQNSKWIELSSGLTNLERKVLEYLRQRPYANPREIADAIGMSLVAVRMALYRLRNRGLVAKTSKGYVARLFRSGALEMYMKEKTTEEQPKLVMEEKTRAEALHKKQELTSSISTKGVAEENLITRDEVNKIIGSRISDLENKFSNLIDNLKKELLAKLKEIEKDLSTTINEDYKNKVLSIEKRVRELNDKIKELEQSLLKITETVESIKKKVLELKSSITLKSTFQERKLSRYTSLLDVLMERGILNIEEARRIVSNEMKSLNDYVREGKVVIVGDLVVLREFYEEILMRLPMPISEYRNLDPNVRRLIDAMIQDGILYIHRGVEIRKV